MVESGSYMVECSNEGDLSSTPKEIDVEGILLSQALLLHTTSPLEELLRFRLAQHFPVDYVLIENREDWEPHVTVRIKAEVSKDTVVDHIVRNTFRDINLKRKFKVQWI